MKVQALVSMLEDTAPTLNSCYALLLLFSISSISTRPFQIAKLFTRLLFDSLLSMTHYQRSCSPALDVAVAFVGRIPFLSDIEAQDRCIKVDACDTQYRCDRKCFGIVDR